MMWLVRMALRRPYTFVVMAMLIVALGALTIAQMPTDIFPDIDIPVISVIWNFPGLTPEDMEKRIVNNYERFLTTAVNDIEHIESQSLTGISVVKIYFQPGAKIEAATAQVTAVSQTAVRAMPPGPTPPFIIRYSASNVPILQIALESGSLSEQQLFDYGVNFIRADVATIRGTQLPWPYGGKQRQIMIDIDPQRLYAWGLSPRDVNAALGLQNVIVPTGTAKIGVDEYPIVLNASPEVLDQIESIPIKVVRGTTVFIRDVAHVRDGSTPQTNIVHVEGKKSVLMSILKLGSASTLDVVKRIRDTLPTTLARLPKELKVSLLFDQSVFVRAAVEGVVKEACIAAGLTAVMLLVFLGSWRSTLIVIVSIPLSILVSIIVLSWLGETLNVMTLGGMALAVGILVDDATVEIENVHRNMAQRKPVVRAILDGAAEIATPAFVSTICICIVFVPVAFIAGAAKSLFVPLALSVVFAMLTSYFLSRTLVPTMMRFLLAKEAAHHAGGEPRSGRVEQGVTRGAPAGGAIGRRRLGALLRGVRARIRSAAHVLRRLAGVGARAPRLRRRRVRRLRGGVARPLPARRSRLLPHRRRGPHQAARARRPGHSDRGDRAQVRADRGLDPNGDPPRSDPDDARQHRHSVQRHQPVAQRRRPRLAGGRGDLHRAQGGPRTDGAIRPPAARDARHGLPRADVLLFGPGHLDAGAQLRAPRRPSTCRSWAPSATSRRRRRSRSRSPSRSRRSPARPTCTSPRCSSSPSSASTWTGRWPRSSA